MKLTKRATAREIAQLYADLGEARAYLERVLVANSGGAGILTGPAQDRLVAIMSKISREMFSLEDPFFALHGRGTNPPFANSDKPRAWLDWLDRREGSA